MKSTQIMFIMFIDSNCFYLAYRTSWLDTTIFFFLTLENTILLLLLIVVSILSFKFLKNRGGVPIFNSWAHDYFFFSLSLSVVGIIYLAYQGLVDSETINRFYFNAGMPGHAEAGYF